VPSRREIQPAFPWLLKKQDWVIHRDQALLGGHSARSIDHRLATSQWRLLLPDVYLCHPGEESRRQRMIAALLYAGPHSAIDGADACRFHGVKAVPAPDERVLVVEPWGAPARSRGFVTIRRTVTPLQIVTTERLRFLAPPAAVIAAARRMKQDRRVVAVLSDALQRRVVTYDELVTAHIQGTPHNARRTDRALATLGSGAMSAPEVDFVKLAGASLVLPRPALNPLLRLPGSGRVISPDALFEDAALIHETNGRIAHARADQFADMQERHDALTAAGFTVLHNTPQRLRLHGREAIAEVERCYERLKGTGLPAGVTMLRLAV
jgi:hypothetical protein